MRGRCCCGCQSEVGARKIEITGGYTYIMVCDERLPSNLSWNLVVRLQCSSLISHSLPPPLEQCSGSLPSSLFYSSLSLNLLSAHRPVSPSTSTSTSSLLVSTARIGMLALKTSGLLVGLLPSYSPAASDKRRISHRV